MMVRRRTLWTEVLVLVLLFSLPAETGKLKKISKDEFEPLAFASEYMGHTREYGKVRRQSPGVYEADSGPLTDEWTAYSQQAYRDDWEDVNWSLDDVITGNLVDDLHGFTAGLDELQEYDDDLDLFSNYQHEISKLNKEMQTIKQLSRNVGKARSDTKNEIGIVQNHDQQNANNVLHLKTSEVRNKRFAAKDEKEVADNDNYTKKGFSNGYYRSPGKMDGNVKMELEDADSDILVYTKEMWCFIVEKLEMIVREFSSGVVKISLYMMEIFTQFFSTFHVDGIGLLGTDSFDFSGIAVFLEALTECGIEVMAMVGSALEDCLVYDVQWIFKSLNNNMMALIKNVVNSANTVFGCIEDLPEYFTSIVCSDMVPSSLDYGFLSFDTVLPAVDSASWKLSLLNCYDHGLVILQEVVGVVLSLMQFLFNVIESIYNSELTLVLREEITKPMLDPLVIVYYQYICPVVQYLVEIQSQFLYCFTSDIPSEASKYLSKVKMANDRVVNVLSSLVLKASDVVQSCGTLECLLSAVKLFLQDAKSYYTLVWVIVYLILTCILIHYSLISSKVILRFCLFLVKLFMKLMISLFLHVSQACNKILKGKPKLVNIGTYCSLKNFNVMIRESEYNELIEASRSKVEQLRRIMELEDELENTQAQNMVGFCKMYQKENKLNKLQSVAAREKSSIDSDDLPDL